MVSRRRLAAVSIAIAGLLALTVAGPVAAHAVEHAGPYTIEIGWQHEPTYVGESNGVQVIVHDADDNPVVDLTADDLKVVVSTADQQSQALTFDPGFDPEEMEGNPGEYDAALPDGSNNSPCQRTVLLDRPAQDRVRAR